jgi:hypothetical protein
VTVATRIDPNNPVVKEILRQGKGKNPRHVAAALETGRVESNYQNLPGGDADSQGWRQERASLYKDPQNLKASVARFYAEAAKLDRGQPSYELAADVQRPAAQFRGRYKDVHAEALGLLKGASVPSPSKVSTSTSGSGSYQTSTPGVDNSGLRKQAVLSYLRQGGVNNQAATMALASQYSALKDVPGTTTTHASVLPSTPGRATGHPAIDRTVDELKQQMKTIDDAQVPYLWGGGHQKKLASNSPVTPLDCSGAVSRALGIDPRVASQFKAWGAPGPGKRVTIYAAKDGSHVLMEVDGHLWGTSATNPGGGAGWIKRSDISPSYLKGFVARHPPGA